MIRINLLPTRKSKHVNKGIRQLSALAGLLLLQIALCVGLYQYRAKKVEASKTRMATLERDIIDLKSKLGNFEELEKQHKRLLAQHQVIESLQSKRKGPVTMMKELSNIMTLGKGPQVDDEAYNQKLRRDPNAAYNPRWNPRRLSLESIDEQGETITVLGLAKDHNDVAELLKRLTLSEYFQNVKLRKNEQVVDKEQNLKLIKFSLSFRGHF